MKPSILFFVLCYLVALPRLLAQNESASHTKDESAGSVKIGLLIPDRKSNSARQGAELAVYEANAKGGYNGHPFLLVVRSMEGPWGTGSKETVNLIFDDEVTAIMGSHDGRNAHLVEQVTTKTRIVFLSAWATDPTLSQAFVPWYFSCVANDLQQADVLIKTIYKRTVNAKIAVISLDDYDSKLGLESFLKRTKAAGKPDPVQLIYNPSNANASALLDQISNAGVNSVVLFGTGSSFAKLLEQIGKHKMNLFLYGSLSFLGDEQPSEAGYQTTGNSVAVPTWNYSASGYKTFIKAYQHKYGSIPNALASYAYDGMNLILEAIKKAGTGRENIQKSLSAIHYEGVTGPIRFDSKGNRMGN
jgi:branched-chain amino acid transport system substrate-binding protein